MKNGFNDKTLIIIASSHADEAKSLWVAYIQGL